MRKDIQLTIPAPCQERWEEMRPQEQGRYCASCAKTVVDFSMMSDKEILAYLARAGQQVCGRLAPEQLDRGLAVGGSAGRTVKRWWHWVLAGLLVSAEAKGQQQRQVSGFKGRVEQVPAPSRTVAAQLARTTAAEDSIKVQELPPVVVTSYGTTVGRMSLVGSAGGISVGRCVKSDTLAARITDTLATLGLLPKKTLAVYPNPVRKGGVVNLTWRETEPGAYDVVLVNAAGAPVQRREMAVNGKEQVDLLEIPASLAAGVYFLSVTRAGDAKIVTRKIVVL